MDSFLPKGNKQQAIVNLPTAYCLLPTAYCQLSAGY